MNGLNEIQSINAWAGSNDHKQFQARLKEAKAVAGRRTVAVKHPTPKAFAAKRP